jgi:hypothetical protein
MPGKDYPKGHVVVPVKIGDTTKSMCLTCGNDGVGKDGELPKTVTPEMVANMLKHRLENGRCEDCFAPEEAAATSRP